MVLFCRDLQKRKIHKFLPFLIFKVVNHSNLRYGLLLGVFENRWTVDSIYFEDILGIDDH